MDKLTRQEVEAAQALLENPVMVRVWEQAEARFIKEWKEADSTERREMAHAKVAGLDEVRRSLRAIIGAGEYASLTRER